MTKHFTLYSHTGGPNGWKVAFLLNELGLEYETKFLDFSGGEHKQPEYLKINPNGRIPALVDHKNNDFTLWESGAILLYLVEKYDTQKKFSASNEAEKYHIYQWLFFQTSGQGPYFGQAAWFNSFHHEKLPSAVERYQAETKRILGVLESVLSTKDWLVGDKFTIADLSFSPWNNVLGWLLGGTEFNFEKDFPRTFDWHNRILAIPGVKAGFEEKTRLSS